MHLLCKKRELREKNAFIGENQQLGRTKEGANMHQEPPSGDS